MPHPSANHRHFFSMEEAFSYLQNISQSRRLWTILKFDTGDRYHVFHSTPTFTQQMFSIAKTIFEMSGHYGRGMPHGRALSAGLTNTLAQQQSGRPHGWGGHAEEHMLQYFNACHGLAPNASTAIIWNSHTPCRTADREPSDNLGGWPRSCNAKLNELARRNPNLTFIVYFRRPFGHLEGVPHPENTLRNEATTPNIRFTPFTTELTYLSQNLP